MSSIPLLPHKGEILTEKRPAYFLEAFERPREEMRIVSLGKCNFSCPYCKREGSYVDSRGNICDSAPVSRETLFEKLIEAIEAGERIRLSGGDPCMFPQLTQEIGEWAKEQGVKLSMAHNGSSPVFARRMAQYLDFAAIDMKASTGRELAMRAGIPEKLGEKMLTNSLRVQEILTNAGVLVDVRMVIFRTTTLDDMLKCAELVTSSGEVSRKFLTFRIYSPIAGLDWKAPNKETILEYVKIVSERFPSLRIGLRAKWEPNGFLIWKNGEIIKE